MRTKVNLRLQMIGTAKFSPVNEQWHEKRAQISENK